MVALLCISSILILSIGIIVPRIQSAKLNGEDINSLETVRKRSRKYFFMSIAPLFIMSVLIYKGTISDLLYQIPAASLVIDIFCLIKLRRILSELTSNQQLRFTYIPFIALAIAKLLLFTAFVLEYNESVEREADFSFSYL